jgi:hypothetical protein
MRWLRSAARVVALVIALAALSTVPVARSQPTQPPAAPSASPPPSVSPAKPDEAASSDVLGEIALTRAGIQARRQAIVTAAMDLSPTESQAFWPLYRDYRTDMARVDDRLVNLITVYASNYDSLTDDMASTLLTDYLDIEKARLDVKSQYVPRFQSVLPARKVARFFQIDNKLDKRIQAELAADIPLTR